MTAISQRYPLALVSLVLFLLLLGGGSLRGGEKYESWLAPDPHEQFTGEGQDDHMGYGRLFVPVMTYSNWEPQYTVYQKEEIIASDIMMGQSLFLKPGTYTVELGSGEGKRGKMRRKIDITEQETTFLKPEWGGFLVEIINESREAVSLGYEIFRMEDNDSVGVKYSKSEDDFYDERSTWILPPGKYKLVRQGEPFNTIYNFMTFELQPGEFKEITIVVDMQDNSFIGAGELDRIRMSLSKRNDWRTFLTVNGSFSWNSDNSLEEERSTSSLSLRMKLDNNIKYDKHPYYLNFRQKIDTELTKTGDDDYRVSRDQFELRNTGIYYFTSIFGIYSEISLESKFFPGNYYFSSEQESVEVLHGDGSVSYQSNINSLRVSPSLFPLKTSEEFGLNFSLLRSAASRLYFRTGIGFVQQINANVYKKNSDEDVVRFEEQENSNLTGLVLAAGASFQFGSISYTSEVNFLYSLLEGDDQYEFSWINNLIFRLFKFISIDYSLDFNYRDEKGYLVYDHRLSLEFSYYFSN